METAVRDWLGMQESAFCLKGMFINLVVLGMAALTGRTAMQLLRTSPDGMWLETLRPLTATLDVGPCAFE